MERRLLLNASSQAIDWITAGVVELTEGYLATLQVRHKLWQDAKAQDADLVELVFQEASCAFYDCDEEALLSVRQYETYGKEGWVELNELNTQLPAAPERTDFDCLIFSAYGVYWRSVASDTVVEVQTELVKYDELFRKGSP